MVKTDDAAVAVGGVGKKTSDRVKEKGQSMQDKWCGIKGRLRQGFQDKIHHLCCNWCLRTPATTERKGTRPRR